jgi:hypothetical protein
MQNPAVGRNPQVLARAPEFFPSWAIWWTVQRLPTSRMRQGSCKDVPTFLLGDGWWWMHILYHIIFRFISYSYYIFGGYNHVVIFIFTQCDLCVNMLAHVDSQWSGAWASDHDLPMICPEVSYGFPIYWGLDTWKPWYMLQPYHINLLPRGFLWFPLVSTVSFPVLKEGKLLAFTAELCMVFSGFISIRYMLHQ